MKNTKNKKLRLLLCAVMAIVLAVSSLSLFSVSAESGKKETYAFFEISDDESTITSSGKTYTRFGLSSAMKYEPRESVYCYYRDVDIRHGDRVIPHSLESSGDGILVARDGTDVIIYLSDTAKANINELIGGKASKYRIEKGYKTAVIDQNFADSLSSYASDNKGNAEQVEVSRLRNMEIYTIRTFDASDSICIDVACIYKDSNGDLFYLNITELDNKYFDADGNISYRQGTLDVVPIKAVFGDAVSGAINKMRNVDVDETIEYDLIDGFDSEFGNTLVPLFWPAYIIVGFLAPIPALIFGIVNSLRKKKGYSKAWIALAILGALWIVTSLLILLCFIL